MKFKTNIPALLLAVLVFVAGNGIAVFEHICNTSQTRSYTLFVKPACEMEKPVAAYCAKKGITKKKDCCEHKQFFKKLSIEGFTANQIELKHFEQLGLNDIYLTPYSLYYNINFSRYISGIPPPDNLFIIKYFLRPTPVELQVFRC